MNLIEGVIEIIIPEELMELTGIWDITGDSLNSILPNAYWVNTRLMSLENRYCKICSTLLAYTKRYVRRCEETVDKLIVCLLLDFVI